MLCSLQHYHTLKEEIEEADDEDEDYDDESEDEDEIR